MVLFWLSTVNNEDIKTDLVDMDTTIMLMDINRRKCCTQ